MKKPRTQNNRDEELRAGYGQGRKEGRAEMFKKQNNTIAARLGTWIYKEQTIRESTDSVHSEVIIRGVDGRLKSGM